jgi:hypothetical protein
VQSRPLLAFPGQLYKGKFRKVMHLLEHIQLDQTLVAFVLNGNRIELGGVEAI